MEERTRCAVNTMFSFVAALIDRSLAFVERSDVTQMTVLNTKMAYEVLLITETRRAWNVKHQECSQKFGNSKALLKRNLRGIVRLVCLR